MESGGVDKSNRIGLLGALAFRAGTLRTLSTSGRLPSKPEEYKEVEEDISGEEAKVSSTFPRNRIRLLGALAFRTGTLRKMHKTSEVVEEISTPLKNESSSTKILQSLNEVADAALTRAGTSTHSAELLISNLKESKILSKKPNVNISRFQPLKMRRNGSMPKKIRKQSFTGGVKSCTSAVRMAAVTAKMAASVATSASRVAEFAFLKSMELFVHRKREKFTEKKEESKAETMTKSKEEDMTKKKEKSKEEVLVKMLKNAVKTSDVETLSYFLDFGSLPLKKFVAQKLRHLSGCAKYKKKIFHGRAFLALIRACSRNDVEILEPAVKSIAHLSLDQKFDDPSLLRYVVGTLAALVDKNTNENMSAAVQRNAAASLRNLSLDPKCHQTLIDCGVIDVLVNNLDTTNFSIESAIQQNFFGIFRSLSLNKENINILKKKGVVDTLIFVVNQRNEEGELLRNTLCWQAIVALHSLVIAGGDCILWRCILLNGMKSISLFLEKYDCIDNIEFTNMSETNAVQAARDLTNRTETLMIQFGERIIHGAEISCLCSEIIAERECGPPVYNARGSIAVACAHFLPIQILRIKNVTDWTAQSLLMTMSNEECSYNAREEAALAVYTFLNRTQKLPIPVCFGGSPSFLKNENDCSIDTKEFRQAQVDVEIFFGDGPVSRFPAHSKLLKAKSDFFYVMLKHSFIESVTRTIHFPDISPEIGEGLLKFMYCNEIQLNCQNIFEYLRCADLYQIDSLLNACTRWFLEHAEKLFTIDQIFVIFDAGMKTNAYILMEECIKFLLYNFNEKELLRQCFEADVMQIVSKFAILALTKEEGTMKKEVIKEDIDVRPCNITTSIRKAPRQYPQEEEEEEEEEVETDGDLCDLLTNGTPPPPCLPHFQDHNDEISTPPPPPPPLSSPMSELLLDLKHTSDLVDQIDLLPPPPPPPSPPVPDYKGDSDDSEEDTTENHSVENVENLGERLFSWHCQDTGKQLRLKRDCRIPLAFVRTNVSHRVIQPSYESCK
eukprot:g1405.t1